MLMKLTWVMFYISDVHDMYSHLCILVSLFQILFKISSFGGDAINGFKIPRGYCPAVALMMFVQPTCMYLAESLFEPS